MERWKLYFEELTEPMKQEEENIIEIATPGKIFQQ